MTTTRQLIADLNLIEDGMAAMKAVEQLLCAAGVTQLNEVSASDLGMLLYVVRDRMRRGINGGVDNADVEPLPAYHLNLADRLAMELGDSVAPANRRRPAK